MAITCTPEALVNAACCFYDLPWDVRKAIRIINYCAFLNGETMECTPTALAYEARCFADCLSSAQLDAIETYLSCQIANGTGGGAAQRVFNGHYGGGTPTQTPVVDSAIADDLDEPFNHWVWDGTTWGPPY
jgi:hypothetical protein